MSQIVEMERAINANYSACEEADGAGDYEASDAAVKAAWDLVPRVFATPSETVADMAAKLRVFKSHRLVDLAGEGNASVGDMLEIFASIEADAERLAGENP